MPPDFSSAFHQLCSLTPKFEKACEDRLAPVLENAYYASGALYGCILAIVAIITQIFDHHCPKGVKVKFEKACEDRLAPVLENAYYASGALYGCILAVVTIITQIFDHHCPKGVKDTVAQLASSLCSEAKPVAVPADSAVAPSPNVSSPFKPRPSSSIAVAETIPEEETIPEWETMAAEETISQPALSAPKSPDQVAPSPPKSPVLQTWSSSSSSTNYESCASKSYASSDMSTGNDVSPFPPKTESAKKRKGKKSKKKGPGVVSSGLSSPGTGTLPSDL